MKLKKFVASNVYGYLNFCIEFYNDLSFLIGVNGSGKTTILRLIQALLTPSILDLMVISFSSVRIIYEDKGHRFEISSSKLSEQLQLKASPIEKVSTFPVIDPDELDFILSRENRSTDLLEEYQLKYSDHEVFKFISNINAPVFLGLERTHKGVSDLTRDLFYERERILSSSARHGLRARRVVKGSLAAGLMETQSLVQEAYRGLRRTEDKHSKSLRESILLSAFRYYDFSFPDEGVDSLLPSWWEKKQILDRKTEIEVALGNIGLSGEKIKKELEEFFRRLGGLFSSVDELKNPKDIPIEWVINKAQIDRVSNLIQIIDEHKSTIDQLFAPINIFLDSVNSFYVDTRKSLLIDTVGQLMIKRPDEEFAPIEALSSGERQLLIIFAHLLFNEYGNRSNVFIIDEPELSLHLKWQESFVSKAIEVSPNTQLILATHSPEILAGYERHSITV